MSQRNRRGSITAEPDKIIPTFSIPWVHKDKWNDKDWFYGIEGKCLFDISNIVQE